jgi:opacity protein-like surface antigen
MTSLSSRTSRLGRASALFSLACVSACISWSTVVHAEASELPPEVGYNYDEIETGRIAGKNGADRALGSSVSALFDNPANMASSRVYHVSALLQLWPEASRQSYGIGAVDSVGSSSRVTGGLGATWTRQDPDGVDRTATDLRFALAYPFSEKLFAGAGGRFMWLSENGDGPLGPSYASAGLAGDKILKSFTFDLGLTLKPGAGLAFALVGNNLNGADNGYQPLTLGGGVGFVRDNFGIEGNLVSDFVTWDENKLRVMAGTEILFGDHVITRAGYRWDQGADSHSGSLGLGYIDKTFSADLGARRVLAGDPVTSIVLTFTYHVESTGLTPSPSETW